jgi:phi13 family phage major tail protein
LSNKITFGLNNVHYALATLSPDGVWSFAEPKALIGAQELSAQVIGGTTDVYADDKVIGTLVSNAGTTLTLKMSELSDDFKKDIFGWEDDVSGNLYEVTNAKTVTFALGYEIQGDAKARRTWYYLCTAAHTGDASKTKSDSPEANSISLTITVRPIETGDKLILRRIASFGDTNYDTFLTTAPALPILGV